MCGVRVCVYVCVHVCGVRVCVCVYMWNALYAPIERTCVYIGISLAKSYQQFKILLGQTKYVSSHHWPHGF